MRRRIFEIIERGTDNDSVSKLYDYFMMACVFISLVPLMFRPNDVPPWLVTMDNIIGAMFVIDYLLRFITEDYRSEKSSIEAFIKYPITPYAIVDLMSILPWAIELVADFYAIKTLKLLRFFRAFKVLRAIKIVKYSRSIRLTRAAINNSKDTLGTVLVLALGYVFVIALLVFNVETGADLPPSDNSINTFADALYFSAVSLTTVGYGDMIPKSAFGRFVMVLSSFVGVAIIALPSGIVTAGYMKALEDEKNNKLEFEDENE